MTDMGTGVLSGLTNIFKIRLEYGPTILKIQMYWSVHFKLVNFMVCELYLKLKQNKQTNK